MAGEVDFNEACRIYTEQLAQSIGMMQATINGYSIDGIPFIEIFFVDSQGRVSSSFTVQPYDWAFHPIKGKNKKKMFPLIQKTFISLGNCIM